MAFIVCFGISGSEVTYGDTVIGQFEGGKGTEPLVIDLNSNATLGAVQALMRNITYQNLGSSSKLGSRTVEFQVTDDGGVPSPKPLTRNVFVTHENTAPTLVVPDRQAVNENAPLKISGITIKVGLQLSWLRLMLVSNLIFEHLHDSLIVYSQLTEKA